MVLISALWISWPWRSRIGWIEIEPSSSRISESGPDLLYRGWKPQALSASGIQSAISGLRHHIDDPVRHDDHLARRLAVEAGNDTGDVEGGLLGFRRGTVLGQGNGSLQLAVQLHRDRDAVLGQQGRVGLGPGGIGQQGSVA